jgi:hypothetical protein
VVPVLIWEISQRDEKNLDRYEGWPSYYFKQDMTVTMTDLDGKNPQEITAMVYLMEDGHDLRCPWQRLPGHTGRRLYRDSASIPISWSWR